MKYLAGFVTVMLAIGLCIRADVQQLKEGGVVEISTTVVIEGDVKLPANTVLDFKPGGVIKGKGVIFGNNTYIQADPYIPIFGDDIALQGSWEADFSPQWFGAVYDGKTDCTAAIQACLHQRGHLRLRGNGTALISKPLVIYGNTWLDLDPGFTLRLADNACCNMLRTPWADQRYFAETFPTFVTTPEYPNFMSADDNPANWKLGEPEQNIRITGGTWDGNGGNNHRTDYLWGSFGNLGHLMVIVNVKGFKLQDTTLYDATTYFFDAAMLSSFEINNIHLDMRRLRPNQDGIHLEGCCFDGIISNIHGRTNDDMIALNGGDSFYPKYPPGVEVPPVGEGTRIRWFWLSRGEIRNIMIRDIRVNEGMTGYRAVRLLSTGNYKMDNIVIDGIYGCYKVDGVLISAHYEPLAPYGTIVVRNVHCAVERSGSPETGDTPSTALFWIEGNVVIDTLMLENIRYQRTAHNGQLLYCQGQINNLFVNNLELGIDADTPQGISGPLTCMGGRNARIKRAFINNAAVNASGDTYFTRAFKGNWQNIHLSNAYFETGKLLDLAPAITNKTMVSSSVEIIERAPATSQK